MSCLISNESKNIYKKERKLTCETCAGKRLATWEAKRADRRAIFDNLVLLTKYGEPRDDGLKSKCTAQMRVE